MAKIADRMDRMAPSGIRKVNEKALAMEKAGRKVIHFEIGRPDFETVWHHLEFVKLMRKH